MRNATQYPWPGVVEDDPTAAARGAAVRDEDSAAWPDMCHHASTCKNFSMGLDCPMAEIGNGNFSCFEVK